MARGRSKQGIRAFVEQFPPLRLALRIDECISHVARSIYNFICSSIKYVCGAVFLTLTKILSGFSGLLSNLTRRFPYQKLSQEDRKRASPKAHWEPVPYRNQLLSRLVTYQGSLTLGTILFAFVYYVLVKHHTYENVAIAFIFFLVFLLVLENSHNIRSILMLCSPIMFTNRGRALIFCSMLTLTVTGPAKNTQYNIGELHSSLNCCKQYLVVKSDKYVDKNVVENLVKVEDIVYRMIDNIKKFADELREKFKTIIQLALTVSFYVQEGLRKLKEIAEVCNANNQEIYDNCVNTFEYAYKDCKYKLGSKFDFLCEVVAPLKNTCKLTRLPRQLCRIPIALIKFLDSTIGERLRHFLTVIENEFYVEAKIVHDYKYERNSSKQYDLVYQEIKKDVENKFWFLHLVARMFNLISLVLVIWITLTATVYHMHYLTELSYDNMYLDYHLKDIDDRRRRRHAEQGSRQVQLLSQSTARTLELEPEGQRVLNIEDESLSAHSEEPSSPVSLSSKPGTREDQRASKEELRSTSSSQRFLFPMTQQHESRYLRPFSLKMNHEEKHKLKIAMLVWVLIVGYILFFVLFDFGLYRLIGLIESILKDLIFSDEIPIVDISTKSGDEIVSYNRTYLHQLRLEAKKPKHLTSSPNRTSSIVSMYRRLLDSLEENIPDDLVILESLETCLPKAKKPSFQTYYILLGLGMITLVAVFIEAYALRTRHCIADLYYPRRARARAAWLYQKIMAEKPKYEEHREPPETGKRKHDKSINLKVS